jgi:hypothetical protein
VNLSPVATCQGMPCLNKGCYSMKAYRLYPQAKESWNHNVAMVEKDIVAFFDSIISHLNKGHQKYFRWHAAGEIPSQEYFNQMIRAALECPQIKFLVFTKKYKLDFSKAPKNLKVIISSWPGLKFAKGQLSPKRSSPIAWMEDGTDPRIKRWAKNQRVCPGSCKTCKACWTSNKDVIFYKH